MTADARHKAFPAPNEPLTLDEACRLIFHNKIRPATLRVERDRGNLVVEKIGRREFVTRRAIEEMRKRCRERQQARDSGSGQASKKTDARPGNQHGSSATERAGLAQAALKANANKLKSRLRNTSSTGTSRVGPATVIPLKS